MLCHDGRRCRPLPSEGRHADFAACTDEEIGLLRYLRGLYNQHVSVQRVLSGNCIGDLYAFAAQAAAGSEKATEPGWLAGADDRDAAISDVGLAGSDPHAVRALELFAQLLGAEAGNIALRGLASGGVVIGGGIPPKINPAGLAQRLAGRPLPREGPVRWMHALPVRVALGPKAALLGAAHHATISKDNR
jgi:glucokinase